jgi:high affinity cGMP-specific 3',5'-cyclic phosphodiesterase 9
LLCADVSMATNWLLGQSDVLDQLSDWEVLGLLLASIIHDVEHPGNSNKFEIKTRSERATTYNDISPLENHHLAGA